jgi:phospholipid/cholesterol/gamma-HCH transport system substrate-binding protein
VLLAIVAFLLFAPSPAREYRLVFANSSQLVNGGVVRIGGTPVGTIKDIELTKNDLAEVRVSVSEEFAPLHEGTTATVRAQGQAGVASRYVDISPGSALGKPLRDNALIPMDSTTSEVEIDQLFNTIDGKTRSGLRHTIKGFSQWYAGKEQQGNESAKELPKTLRAFSGLAEDITAQNAQFERLVRTTGQALSGVAANHEQLTGSINGARRTVQAIGQDSASLNTVLQELPDTLEQGSDAFVNLRPALTDLQRLADASDKPSRILAPFLREDVTPVFNDAVPVFRQLRLMLDRPGSGNDLLESLQDLPPLERSTRKAFPQGSKALKTSTPMLSFIRPYAPDLIGWFHGFSSSAATYDGYGHYFRALPVFDAFRFKDDAQGGTFTEKPPSERGKGDGLTSGNLKRCPGAATAKLPDNSAPFVDQGPLSNADCDPSETPVGG